MRKGEVGNRGVVGVDVVVVVVVDCAAVVGGAK